MPDPVDGLTPLLEVFDLPASIAFYSGVLGFELVSRSDAWCMLRLGAATLMLNTAYDEDERPQQPEPDRVRGHADTSLYLSTPDCAAVYTHLREKHWPATAPRTTIYQMREVSTRDPDGFQIFFISPLDPAPAQPCSGR